ncbi:MAG: hypothetical protein FJ291_00020 [Planctomycetes bacterium]|nr:hypothetical protein [Planctomycetota bacterium]
MKRKTEAKCPYCGGSIEHFPDQDASCDYQCTRCSWHEHVPGETEIAQAKAESKRRPEKGGD